MDNTQKITDTFNYWPYGDIQSRTGTTPTPFQFVGTKGYYKDSASINTKTYVRARHYDVAKARWLTQDPIGFDGGDWNLYRYCANNPMTMVDASGEAPRRRIPRQKEKPKPWNPPWIDPQNPNNHNREVSDCLKKL